MNILAPNEEAYRKRYGYSLQSMLEQHVAAGDLEENSQNFYRQFWEKSRIQAEQMTYGNNKECLLHMIVGMGEGSFAAFYRKAQNGMARFLIYEPDAASFLWLSTQKDISHIIADPGIVLVIYEEEHPRELTDALKEMIHIGNADHVTALITPGYEDFYGEIAEAVIREAGKCIDAARVSGKSYRHFRELPCQNEMYAYRMSEENYMIESLLRAVPLRDIPIILVAAGPSLQKNVGELAKAKGKAIIIVVAHALAPVLQAGIFPDLVAHMDPNSYLYFLQEDRARKCRMLLNVKVDRNIQEAYQGQCIYYGFSDIFFPKGILSDPMQEGAAGGSVATEIFTLFRRAGFRNFILVGQDLAYGDEGMSHCGEKQISTHDEHWTFTESIKGDRVKTRDDWLGFLHYFEEEIAVHPEIRVVDATEGGAKIRGTQIMSLKEAIGTICRQEYPVDDWLDSMTRGSGRKAAVSPVEHLNELLRGIGSVRKDLEKAIQCNKKLLGIRSRKSGKNPAAEKLGREIDILYHTILEGKEGEILIYYAEDQVEEYIRRALSTEMSGETEDKLKLESDLYQTLIKKVPELEVYMKSLIQI